MSNLSAIEWTDYTSNPLLARRLDTGKIGWGCEKVSQGCANCYAESWNGRNLPARGTGLRYTVPAVKLIEPYLNMAELSRLATDRALSGKRVFMGDMTDMFWDFWPDAWLDNLFGIMSWRPDVTFQILTKRSERMLRYSLEMMSLTRQARAVRVVRSSGWDVPDDTSGGMDWPLPNVWLGTSVENQATADERIPLLLRTPAAVRFISAEPLLGPINLVSTTGGTLWIGGQRGCGGKHHGDGSLGCPRELHHHHDERCGPGLDWVIVGGESGRGARPMHPDWALSLRDQCTTAAVPFFFKQWGEYAEIGWRHTPTRRGDVWLWSDGTRHVAIDAEMPASMDGVVLLRRVGKKNSGRLLDGRTWDGMPNEKPNEKSPLENLTLTW